MPEKPTAASQVVSSNKSGFLRKLGPGLITGAADDDPSGIATYSQAGAQFGYGMGWVLVLTIPMMVVIQIAAAEIGRVTGAGIASNLRRHYSRKILWAVVGLLLVANIINLGADLSAMGAALALFTGGNAAIYTLIFGAICVSLEVFVNYARYAGILKWATVSLCAYVAVVIVAGVDWPNALRSLVLPDLKWDKGYATTMVAILGTTISPYLFFWQAGQEIEEEHRHHAKPLCITPEDAGSELLRIRNDTLIGMTFSNLVALAIVFATAATLHAHGVTEIATSAQAAEALRPIAGDFAFALFALGIIGTGMLAVPILAGSAAYAVTELVGVAGSLDAKPLKAKFFYATIAVTVLSGSLLGVVGLDPVKALYWAAVVNGVLAAPLLAVMMLIARNPRAMGRLTLSNRMVKLGWLATLLMAVASGVFFYFLLA
jgi:NRAMP (natural resistance-associated macrophage protein)-like metal ion transporter